METLHRAVRPEIAALVERIRGLELDGGAATGVACVALETLSGVLFLAQGSSLWDALERCALEGVDRVSGFLAGAGR